MFSDRVSGRLEKTKPYDIIKQFFEDLEESISAPPSRGFSAMVNKTFLLCFATCVLVLSGALKGPVEARERVTVGVVEEVILLPWGVKLPARIDTGAATTSLDVRNLRIEGDIADFSLPKKYGGLHLRLPVVAWKNIRNAEARERRPIVEIEVCLGSKRVLTRVNLNDRSHMKYPLIVGRSLLKENYVVDCMTEMCAQPRCPETSK